MGIFSKIKNKVLQVMDDTDIISTTNEEKLVELYQTDGMCLYCRSTTYVARKNSDDDLMSLFCETCGLPVIIPSKAISDLMSEISSDLLQ